MSHPSGVSKGLWRVGFLERPGEAELVSCIRGCADPHPRSSLCSVLSFCFSLKYWSLSVSGLLARPSGDAVNGNKHILRGCTLHNSEEFSPGVDRSGLSALLCHTPKSRVLPALPIFSLLGIILHLLHWVAMNLIISTECSAQCETTHKHSVNTWQAFYTQLSTSSSS